MPQIATLLPAAGTLGATAAAPTAGMALAAPAAAGATGAAGAGLGAASLMPAGLAALPAGAATVAPGIGASTLSAGGIGALAPGVSLTAALPGAASGMSSLPARFAANQGMKMLTEEEERPMGAPAPYRPPGLQGQLGRLSPDQANALRSQLGVAQVDNVAGPGGAEGVRRAFGMARARRLGARPKGF